MTKEGIDKTLSHLAATQADQAIKNANSADQARKDGLAEVEEARRAGALRAAGIRVDLR